MEETLEQILKACFENSGNIITILQDIDKQFGYIPEKAVNWLAKKLDIPASRLFGIITFYSEFHLHPTGANIITVCRGSACHVNGSERLLNRLLLDLGIPPSENTTEDFKFTVEKVNCMGACSMAPLVMINDELCGKITFDNLIKKIRQLKDGE